MSTEPGARQDVDVKKDASTSASESPNGHTQNLDDNAQEKNNTPAHPPTETTAVDSPFFLTSDGKPAKRKGLPEWLNHFNARDLKMLFKASIAVWTFSLFIWINPLLRQFGQATFFGW